MKSTWFISDLHLDLARPANIQQFLELLKQLRSEADALYILGDLFEYWVGDDILDTHQGEVLLPIIDAIKALSDSGVDVPFIHGNRDFLIGESFAERTGCKLLPEQLVIDLNGTPTLIMHGDTLCTDDHEYQKARGMMRSVEWQQQLLRLSIPERIQKAQEYRKLSAQTTASQQEEILDTNQQAVIDVMREQGVTQLIHGHTHRPAVHQFELDGKMATRIVLGDWYDQSSYLRVDSSSLKLTYSGKTESVSSAIK